MHGKRTMDRHELDTELPGKGHHKTFVADVDFASAITLLD